jgi:hypothetical protein
MFERSENVPVVRITAEEIEERRGNLSTDPAVAKLYDLTKEHVEREGGVALAVFKLYLAKVWGEPFIMTPDEVARRLGLPVSQVTAIIKEVQNAVRPEWLATPAYRSSHFAAD